MDLIMIGISTNTDLPYYYYYQKWIGLVDMFNSLSTSFVSLPDMDTAMRVQFLDKTDCISHSTNTLGKGMNPIILPPAMGK